MPIDTSKYSNGDDSEQCLRIEIVYRALLVGILCGSVPLMLLAFQSHITFYGSKLSLGLCSILTIRFLVEVAKL